MEKSKRLKLDTIGSLIMEFILAIAIIDLQTLTVDLTFKKISVFFKVWLRGRVTSVT